ncbi:MAG: Glutamate racemase [Thermotoga sp. 50_1627]|uniref:glutamate racemase n=1 Tax=Pseudothermotoga sp. TaxID=2033661 RepID=UPI00076DCCB8|nr:MAG: Glutamate racemase [Thermotoga sp. 50_64]KUK25566.1 MAG: Glutamate racemase [Thermotoga sp. 50_1627]MBC7116591.1 aspartate/glutamate racemase family protein [Pseudothermotoga sp.]MDK2922602.1 glutamate racemase [Pseudothermotoga sp.]
MSQLIRYRAGCEYLYVADTAHAPFGTKSVEEVKDIALDCIRFLRAKGADVVISACNTAQAALMALNAQPQANFFGILDFDLPSDLKKVGVVATEATVSSGVYLDKMNRIGVEVFQRPCQELVSAIESCAQDEKIERIVSEAVDYMRQVGVDAIILGCTHFPLVKHVFEGLSGGILVLDPAELLAKKLEGLLLKNPDGKARVKFYVSSDAESFSKKVQRYGVALPYTVEEFSWGEVTT